MVNLLRFLWKLGAGLSVICLKWFCDATAWLKREPSTSSLLLTWHNWLVKMHRVYALTPVKDRVFTLSDAEFISNFVLALIGLFFLQEIMPALFESLTGGEKPNVVEEVPIPLSLPSILSKEEEPRKEIDSQSGNSVEGAIIFIALNIVIKIVLNWLLG